MTDLKLTCDNCGSMFTLSFEQDEVSYSPSHCPFCGDYYDNDKEELNFNDNDDEDFEFGDEEELNQEDDDDYRRH